MNIEELIDELEKQLNEKEEKELNSLEWDYLMLVFMILNMKPESTINIYLGGI